MYSKYLYSRTSGNRETSTVIGTVNAAGGHTYIGNDVGAYREELECVGHRLYKARHCLLMVQSKLSEKHLTREASSSHSRWSRLTILIIFSS